MTLLELEELVASVMAATAEHFASRRVRVGSKACFRMTT